jgi:predicted nuclease of predicted toxin-antitoxin system
VKFLIDECLRALVATGLAAAVHVGDEHLLGATDEEVMAFVVVDAGAVVVLGAVAAKRRIRRD